MSDKLNPEFWKDRRVCVTGGAGFLGSFVIEKLEAVGGWITLWEEKLVD